MKNSYIEEFEKYHNLKIPNSFTNGKDSADISLKLHNKLNFVMSQLVENDFHKYPTVGIIYQLINRIHEQLKGALSCICTNNHASSEVLSRTAIESSVNILYFFKDDTESKVFAWLKKYIDEDKQHIREWKQSLKTQEEKTFIHQELRLEKYSTNQRKIL